MVRCATLLGLLLSLAIADDDPFEFFRPSLTLSAVDRLQLDQGDPIVRIVPGDASEVGVFAAVPIEIDGDRLVAWMRRIEELLTADEMAELQRVAAGAGRDWKPGVQQAFRTMVLQRVNAYLADGNAALAPYADHAGGDVWPAATFGASRR